MKELTIESLKKIGFRYGKNNSLIDSLASFKNIAYDKLLAILLQSIVTFSSEEQLINFLKSEIPKLKFEHLKEIFNITRGPNREVAKYTLKYLIDYYSLKFSDIELIFIFIVTWKLHTSANGNTDIVKFLLELSDKNMIKSIAFTLSKIDYLEYFNLNDYKKELFEISMGIY